LRGFFVVMSAEVPELASAYWWWTNKLLPAELAPSCCLRVSKLTPMVMAPSSNLPAEAHFLVRPNYQQLLGFQLWVELASSQVLLVLVQHYWQKFGKTPGGLIPSSLWLADPMLVVAPSFHCVLQVVLSVAEDCIW
jgi:hypothetical protein